MGKKKQAYLKLCVEIRSFSGFLGGVGTGFLTGGIGGGGLLGLVSGGVLSTETENAERETRYMNNTEN